MSVFHLLSLWSQRRKRQQQESPDAQPQEDSPSELS